MGKTVTGIRIALVGLLCAPLMAYSAGLGRLTVNSSLGQQLNAEIDIVSLQPGEEDSLTARLGTAEAFRQAGIELSSVLVSLQLSIDKRGGRPVIRLTTVQPINEPFLDVLIELQWATGRLVREYTFLLDPPEYRSPKPAASAPAAAPAAAGAKQETVKKGDTLGTIARRTQPDGVTPNQMLIALFRANQDAFIRGNVNLVRAGRILNVPDREAIAAVTAAEANQLVQSHMADFADYKRKLGAAVAAAPAAPVRERVVTGRITSKPETPAPAEQKDQLKLSNADPGKTGTAAAQAAREDDRVARERTLKESQSRAADLEKNVADLQKLAQMKSQQLAELEKRAAAKPAPVAKAPKEAAKDAPKEVVKDAPKEVANAKPAAAAAKGAPEKSFVEDPVALGGLGTVVLLLGGYGAWAWRKKKASQSQFQDSVLGAATGVGASSVFAPASPPAHDTPPPAADPDATVSMDFDLNLNLDLGSSKPEPEKAAQAPIDLGGLSLDLGTPGDGGGGGNDAKWQEVATKLDLAKACQEMGDKDGARELLNEVLKEGDAAQQSQAQQMLSGLG